MDTNYIERTYEVLKVFEERNNKCKSAFSHYCNSNIRKLRDILSVITESWTLLCREYCKAGEVVPPWNPTKNLSAIVDSILIDAQGHMNPREDDKQFDHLELIVDLIAEKSKCFELSRKLDSKKRTRETDETNEKDRKKKNKTIEGPKTPPPVFEDKKPEGYRCIFCDELYKGHVEFNLSYENVASVFSADFKHVEGERFPVCGSCWGDISNIHRRLRCLNCCGDLTDGFSQVSFDDFAFHIGWMRGLEHMQSRGNLPCKVCHRCYEKSGI